MTGYNGEMRRTFLRLLVGAACCLGLAMTAQPEAKASSLPRVIREAEKGRTTYYGTWTWNGRGYFDARWNNGAVAIITVVKFDGRNVVLKRSDPSGASTGMVAYYYGTLSGRTFSGKVYWYYRGPLTGIGTWSASF